ncbi:MAG: ABC transporter ATP-binding protein/permease [Streptosporangiales bacterium]|nr:ABC transporter ATP-binding protein/permease [Streptosporangiales bacterium]
MRRSQGRNPGRSRPARLITGVTVSCLRRHPRDAAWLAVWSVVEVAPVFALGRALSGATNAFLAGPGHLAAGFGWLGLLVAAAAFGSAGARLACRRLAALVEPLRDDLVRRIVTGAVRRCVDAGEPPDDGACARISHQTEIVRDSFGGLLSALRLFVFVAGGALAGLATLLPAAIPVTIGPPLIGLAIFALLVGPLVRRQRDYVLTEEAVAAGGTRILTALRDITACGGEEQAYAAVSRDVDAQARATRGVARMAAARSLAVAAGGLLPVPLVLAASPWLLRGGASAGQVVGTLAYLTGGLQPALHTLVQGVGSSGVRMAITLERILEASAPGREDREGPGEEPGDEPGETEAPRARAPGVPDGVELRGLTFGYGPGAIPVIRDLDLVIPDGDHLAVVGPSGVGKSTLAALIAGTLTPGAGEVRLGGVPLDRLGPRELPGRRVLIPQEAYVFDGTLGENLAYLNQDATTADLDQAVGAVGMRDLAERIGGYTAVVGPAVLSAGERQLIALARAYLSPARLVLLDEATCHLDPAAEAVAERAFAERPGTLVVIAHRMSSALRARRILVLDGDRADAGSHDALLADSALYRDLAGYWDQGRAGRGRDRAGQSQPAPSALRMASTRVRAPVLPIAREM